MKNSKAIRHIMNDNSNCLVGQICKTMLAAIVDISYLSLQMKQHDHSTIQASCPILFLEKNNMLL